MSSTSSPIWCPEQQIYIGGVVPDSSEIESLLKSENGTLRIFGYGSLCWSPGTGALAKAGVTKVLGRAIGYQRCWAQKSADHRGTPSFPGIVCTLLTDKEVHDIRSTILGEQEQHNDTPSMTEGVIYTIPPEQVEDCLAELDFREKGGYARDVTEVVESSTGRSFKALLYRGTPDNPAFWSRALMDLPFAAAIMAVSIGPSGNNSDYLFQLEEFMRDSAKSQQSRLSHHVGDSRTGMLATMTRDFQRHDLTFLFGSGSNQHNQLLLASDQNNAGLVNGEDAHKLTEIVVCTQRKNAGKVTKLFAGGGHSGMLTEHGYLYLWGWNSHGQLGTCVASETNHIVPTITHALQNIKVEDAAFGFTHTLVIEKDTGKLLAFGENERGKVSGSASTSPVMNPITPDFAKNETFLAVAAGLFHSAAITSKGDLLTFGCSRFGQALRQGEGATFGKWRPADGSRLVQVACGRRHTVILDEHGRVWTFGENKYGQLGRSIREKFDNIPQLVNGPLGEGKSGCIAIACGWSHTLATIQTTEHRRKVYGWGRNDKGQLGTGSSKDENGTPMRLFENLDHIESVCCGSESTMILDQRGKIVSCGWNEHGNLSIGTNIDSLQPLPIMGASIVAPPPSDGEGKVIMAAGGAHFITMRSAI